MRSVAICVLAKTTTMMILSPLRIQSEKNNKETILGIKIDQKLTFSSHIKTLCTKAGQKLRALVWISNYLDQNRNFFL